EGPTHGENSSAGVGVAEEVSDDPGHADDALVGEDTAGLEQRHRAEFGALDPEAGLVEQVDPLRYGQWPRVHPDRTGEVLADTRLDLVVQCVGDQAQFVDQIPPGRSEHPAGLRDNLP